MTTLVEILKSVIRKLKTGCPGIRIYSKDIEEGFKRPCFFVDLSNIKENDSMGAVLEKNIKVRIRFFPTDPKVNQFEILEMLDELNKIFLYERTIFVSETMAFECSSVEKDIIKKVLHYDFKIFIAEEYERIVTAEMMDEIIIS